MASSQRIKDFESEETELIGFICERLYEMKQHRIQSMCKNPVTRIGRPVISYMRKNFRPTKHQDTEGEKKKPATYLHISYKSTPSIRVSGPNPWVLGWAVVVGCGVPKIDFSPSHQTRATCFHPSIR